MDPIFVPNCTDAHGTPRVNCFQSASGKRIFYDVVNPNDLVWIASWSVTPDDPSQQPPAITDGNIIPGSLEQIPRDVVLWQYLLPYREPQGFDDAGNQLYGPTIYPGTQDAPLNDGANLLYAAKIDTFYIGGGGFFSGLTNFVKTALVAAVAPAALAVGGATAANASVNVIEGNDLTQNMGVAAAIDVAGLAAGAGIAASGIADASALAAPASVDSAAIDTGALVTEPAGAEAATTEVLSPTLAEPTAADVAAANASAADFGADVTAALPPPVAIPAAAAPASTIGTLVSGGQAALTGMAGAVASAKTLFNAVTSARTGKAGPSMTTQSTIAAQPSSGGAPTDTGGLALDYAPALRALLIPGAILVIAAKFAFL